MSLENLKIIMKMKGFNAETLADKSGVPKSTVDKILSGNTPDPRYSTVKDLVNALNLNVDELIYYLDLSTENVSHKLRPEDYELIRNYHELDAHGKDVIDCLLEKELQRCASPKKVGTKETAYSYVSSGPQLMVAEDSSFPMYDITHEYEPNAAHARTDIKLEEGIDASEDDIMDDENF